MKILFLTLILIIGIQNLSKANDITNFEMEGISIGDSLLEFFEKNLIDNEIKNPSSLFYKNNEFVQIGASSNKNYKLNIESNLYDDLSIVIKPNDNFYKVYSISGRIFCDDIEFCKSKKKEITLNLESFFDSDNILIDNINKDHSGDPSGNSKTYTTYFEFKNNESYAFVGLYDWSEKLEREKNYPDNLKVGIVGEEFAYFLRNVQYN